MSSSRRLAILFVTTGFVLLGSFIVLFLIGAVSMREYLVLQTHQGISEQLSASLSWLREAEFARDQVQAYGPDWRLPRSKGSMRAIIEPAA